MTDSMKQHAGEQKEKLPCLHLATGASVARALHGVSLGNRSQDTGLDTCVRAADATGNGSQSANWPRESFAQINALKFSPSVRQTGNASGGVMAGASGMGSVI